MSSAKQEIETIKERNRRVELDKAWETSMVRRLFIMTATYVIAGIWLWTIGNSKPWLNAFVPAGGYLLSTLSLSLLKQLWIINRRRGRGAKALRANEREQGHYDIS